MPCSSACKGCCDARAARLRDGIYAFGPRRPGPGTLATLPAPQLQKYVVMNDGVSGTSRSVSPEPVSSGSQRLPDGGSPRPQGRGLGHPDLQSRGAGRQPDPESASTVATAVVSYLPSMKDVAAMALAGKPLRHAASPLLRPVQSLVGLASGVAAGSQPLADAERVLDMIGRLPLDQRFWPLKALAAQVPKLLNEVANQVAERITQAASCLASHEQAALAAAMRGPDNGLQRGFFQTGFF